MKTEIKNTLNLGIVGVLAPTKNETKINDEIKKLHGNDIYWLPWGCRFETLTKVCQYLYKHEYWTCAHKICKNHQTFLLYSSKQQENRYPLIFFHHDSKKQGGNGLIYYKYEIDKIIISKNKPIEIKTDKLKYTPIKIFSKVWFGITRMCALEREGIDFGSFHIHPEIMQQSERQVNKIKDSAFLYYQVLPIKEPFHNDNDRTCNCLICR